MTNGSRKRQRAPSSTRLSSTATAVVGSASFPRSAPTEKSQKIGRISSSTTSPSLPPPIVGGFNDPSCADIILRLYIDNSSFEADTVPIDSEDQISDIQIFVHSNVLRRAKYFDALLSDRWKKEESDDSFHLRKVSLGVVPNTGSIRTHLVVIRLLYTEEYSDVIDSVAAALSLLPVALKLLFEGCIKECVRFLEAVPWSEEEELQILELVPFLGEAESKELISRVYPAKTDTSEEMLHNLILSAIHSHPTVATVKAFVARLLRDFTSKDSAKRVLQKAFLTSLTAVKESMEQYSSPYIRGNHSETEAIQRLNLHTASSNGKQLLWLVERMIELRVADKAVEEWSEQASFTADLQRAFREDAWRNIVPGLPNVVLKCTCKLANAVASGNVLVAWQVRKKLVKDWLPVLIVCKDNASPLLPYHHKPIMLTPKPLYLELEEAFLRIISTLPLADAQEVLQQCLSFTTRDSEDCPHLIIAFNTWFRRATRPPQSLNF